MLDYIFGLILYGLGMQRHAVTPGVLGDETVSMQVATAGGTPVSSLRILHPVLTKEQEDAFQKARKAGEAKIAAVTEKRLEVIRDSFESNLKTRELQDEASRAAFERKVNAFKNADKKRKVLDIADKFEGLVHGTLVSMQHKLAALSALLDKLSVAVSALKTQGKDVSVVDSDITAAQAKVTTALTLTQTLAGTVTATIPVSGETSAGQDIQAALRDTKAKLRTLYGAFTDARGAVEKALSDMEVLTKPVEVAPTP